MIILNKDKPQKNEYIFWDESEKIKSINKKKVILTKGLWIQKGQLLKKNKIISGIQLNSDESLDEITDDILYFSLVQFNFLSFKDGRPFSIAKTLRKKLNFKKFTEVQDPVKIAKDRAARRSATVDRRKAAVDRRNDAAIDRAIMAKARMKTRNN